ncbi:uncharacterized protein LOC125669221 [Ostrea edulis]|uniref:uncharacterized protein LOC125669221 n=1 Tax=Ostrea edulis TaxID=37623 RepID=UPI0024AFE1A6|nr:uncharacterized protein LOC125669221 [Ostrea edulis]
MVLCEKMGLVWLATIALCIHCGFTQNIGPSQIRFRGPPQLPLGSSRIQFSGTPFAGARPSNGQQNFIPQSPTPRRQITFSNTINSFAPAMPTTSPLLSGSVSGSNFGNVNSQTQGLVTEPSISVDVGNLDFGSVAQAVMTDMFTENLRRGNLLGDSNRVNTNSQTFGGVNTNSQTFGGVNTNSQTFGGVNTNSQTFGSVNTNSQTFGGVNTNSQTFGGVNTNSQTFSQGQTSPVLTSVNDRSQLDSGNALQNNQVLNNFQFNANSESPTPIGSELRPVQLLNNEGSSMGNRVNINFRTGTRRNSNSIGGSNLPQTVQNSTGSVTLAPAFPGFAPLQLPELGEDSWFSYLKGLLDRTNSNMQIFSNSTGGGMHPIPQRLMDLPRGTMPIYIKNFRSNPAYVPFRLPGQPFNMLIPFNRENREMVYPYLPIYIPYPNVGIDVPEVGLRFVAYLPFQPDRYKASREGAGVVFPQRSAPGSFPLYVDRRPVLTNLMEQMG